MRDGALSSIRVLDFSWVGAGSFTTRLLAEHGADVIKIESTTHVDSLRIGPPFAGGVPGVNRSGYFAERNANKRSVTVNLKSQRGLELVRELVANADIVANNFRPGVMDSLGLSYEQVSAINPRVIYLSMSMQGATGPESGYLGYGITIAATTGMTHLSGDPDRYPVGTGTHYPDHVPNPGHAAFALLAAVRHQRRTGQGQLIEIAQTEPTIASIGVAIMDWTANGVDDGPVGNTDPRYQPHGVYPTAGDDQWIAIAARTDAERERLREIVGDDLDTGIWDGTELMLTLQAAGVPSGIVATARDIVDHDPQLAARGHWRYLDHAEMGRSVYGVSPFRLSTTPGNLDTPAPLLGQHTSEVLRDLLGLDEAEISQLAADGVLS